MVQQNLVGHDGGIIFIEASQWPLDTPYVVGLFCMSDDQPDAEASTWQTHNIHNLHNRQTSTSPAGFKPAILASNWAQAHALDCAATEI
jgi:hypothetical protein